ncbi:CAP domain-containing protein [Nonomuraea sp. NPDC051191]|uniref:CAP domain-containing protein n=1 Tax=Nonomuraea sp. NPDC051191 TaxID=3364372 RepID=UPI0037AA762E
MRHTTHVSPVFAASGALLLALAAATPPQVTAETAATKFGRACDNAYLVFKPRSAYPDTNAGNVWYRRQFTDIELSLFCLVNELRAQYQRPPVNRVLLLSAKVRGINGAAADHARAAAQQRWWGTVEQVPGCKPYPLDPSRCDSHYDPVSQTDPVQRAKNNKYGSSCPTWSVGENTYTGWGAEKVTPRAAFEAWKHSPPHLENMLRPEFKQMAIGTAVGSADPSAPADFYPAITYVQDFGTCG